MLVMIKQKEVSVGGSTWLILFVWVWEISRIRLGQNLNGRLQGNSKAVGQTRKAKKHSRKKAVAESFQLSPRKIPGHVHEINRSQPEPEGDFLQKAEEHRTKNMR